MASHDARNTANAHTACESLKGRNAVITGGTMGMGGAVAVFKSRRTVVKQINIVPCVVDE